jgi:hypothetical protein
MAAISPEEVDGLMAALEGVLTAIEISRETIREFDALPPPETPGEIVARSWLRRALVDLQMEILLPPVTIWGVILKVDPHRRRTVRH